MGEITDMLLIRMEELQIGWACSAQNPALLPDSIKRNKGSNLASKADQHFPPGQTIAIPLDVKKSYGN